MNTKKNKAFWLVGVFFVCFIFWGFFFPEAAHAGIWGEWLKEKLGAIAWETFGLLLVKLPMTLCLIFAWLAEFIFWVLFEIATVAVNKFFDPTFYKDELQGFVTNPVVQSGWSLIVGLVNLFFVIVLLFVGVGTLLRVEKYDYKKLLIKLAICALLTNFSLLFAGIILDLTHVIMFSDLFGNPIAILSGAVRDLLWDGFTKIPIRLLKLIGADDFEEAAGLSMGVFMEAIFVASAAMVIIATAFFLLLRVVALWLLLVLSPFAYIALVLPDTKNIADRWWSAFLKYAFLGPILFFFVWFAAQMTQKVILSVEFTKSNVPQEQNIALNKGPSWTNPEKALGDSKAIVQQKKVELGSLWIKLTLITVLLWGGLLAASSMGVVAAGAVMGAAKMAMTGAAVFTTMGAGSAALRFARKRSEARSEKQGLRAGEARTQLAGMSPNTEAYTQKQQEIEQLSASESKWKKTSQGLRYANAFNPIKVARSMWAVAKVSRKQEEVDDAQALAGTAGQVWDSITGKTNIRRNIVEGQVQNERNAQRENAKAVALKGGLDIDGVDIDDADIENQIVAMEDNLKLTLGIEPEGDLNLGQAEQTLINKIREQEIAVEKSQTDEEKQGNQEQLESSRGDLSKVRALAAYTDLNEGLAESEDQQHIAAARSSVDRTRWQDTFNYDAVDDKKVQEATKGLEYMETAELISLFASADESKREAIVLKIQANTDMNDLLTKNGYNTTQHNEFFKDNFSERRSVRLAARAQAIGERTRDYNSTEFLEYDPKAGRMRLIEDNEKRQRKIFKKTQKVSSRDYVSNLGEDNVLARTKDGRRTPLPYAEDLYDRLANQGVEAAHLLKPRVLVYLKESQENIKNKVPGWTNISDKAKENLDKFIKDVELAQASRFKAGKSGLSSATKKPQDDQNIVHPGGGNI